MPFGFGFELSPCVVGTRTICGKRVLLDLHLLPVPEWLTVRLMYEDVSRGVHRVARLTSDSSLPGHDRVSTVRTTPGGGRQKLQDSHDRQRRLPTSVHAGPPM